MMKPGLRNYTTLHIGIKEKGKGNGKGTEKEMGRGQKGQKKCTIEDRSRKKKSKCSFVRRVAKTNLIVFFCF